MALLALGSVIAGLVLIHIVPFRFSPTGEDEAGTDGPTAVAHRRLGFAFRRSWLRPILIDLLYTAHWGVIVAFLPQRAEAAGANIGLFFVADGIAIIVTRVPSGWLADRVRPVYLVLAGLLATGCAVVVLTAAPATPLLVLAGTLTGTGGGLDRHSAPRRAVASKPGRRSGQRVLAVLGRQRDGARGRQHRRGVRRRDVRLRGRHGRGARRDRGCGGRRGPGPRPPARPAGCS